MKEDTIPARISGRDARAILGIGHCQFSRLARQGRFGKSIKYSPSASAQRYFLRSAIENFILSAESRVEPQTTGAIGRVAALRAAQLREGKPQ